MKIREAVKPDLIFLDLEAEDADHALSVIAHRLGDAASLDADMVFQALKEREELGSTSVGNGFAIPHCKLPRLESVVVALARVENGVPFGDGKNHEPVRFFFVVLSPPDQPAEHLQVLSQIARALKNNDLRNRLLEVSDNAQVVSSIRRASEQEGL
jgi:mannitol/fructose-specific phosphotransferase system IIA component (Ntr-type)